MFVRIYFCVTFWVWNSIVKVVVYNVFRKLIVILFCNFLWGIMYIKDSIYLKGKLRIVFIKIFKVVLLIVLEVCRIRF